MPGKNHCCCQISATEDLQSLIHKLCLPPLIINCLALPGSLGGDAICTVLLITVYYGTDQKTPTGTHNESQLSASTAISGCLPFPGFPSTGGPWEQTGGSPVTSSLLP